MARGSLHAGTGAHLLPALAVVLLGGVLHGAAAKRAEAPSAPSVATFGSIATGPAAGRDGGGGSAVRAAPADSSRAERVRARLDARIRDRFPAEGAMVSALLLAERGGVDREVRDAFRRSGTSHLLAISGFHVGVIAGWIVLLLRVARLSRRRAAAGAALAVWGYVALLGFPGSASRAATIFTLLVVGRLLGRPVQPVAAWGTALLLVAVASPARVLEIGTQLSFLGALGLVLWARPWTEALVGAARGAAARAGRPLARKRVEGVAGAVAASAAAQWATLALAAWAFQQVALAGLPATLVATPLVTFVLPGALLTLAADALRLPGTALAAAGVEALLASLRTVVGIAGSIGPVLRVAPVTAGAGLLAALVARAGVRCARRAGRATPRAGAWIPVSVVCAVLLASPVADRVGLRGTEVHVLDVGQGDAIAIRSRAGRWVVIDAGPPPGDRLVRALLRTGVTRIDLLVLTHPDLDHIGGAAALLEEFTVGAVLDPVTVKGGAWRELLTIAERREIPWRVGRAGDRFAVDDLRFRVLSPGPGVEGTGEGAPANDRSLVLSLRVGNFDALFTGDVPVEVERGILAAGAELPTEVELLKVAHHGSRTSTGHEWLAAVRPRVAIIPVGRRNRFGHPAPEVVRRLEAGGTDILRTDLHGTVTVRLDPDGTPRIRTARIPVPRGDRPRPDRD